MWGWINTDSRHQSATLRYKQSGRVDLSKCYDVCIIQMNSEEKLRGKCKDTEPKTHTHTSTNTLSATFIFTNTPQAPICRHWFLDITWPIISIIMIFGSNGTIMSSAVAQSILDNRTVQPLYPSVGAEAAIIRFKLLFPVLFLKYLISCVVHVGD